MIAYKLINYNQSQISENKPDETPYVMIMGDTDPCFDMSC